MAKPGRRGRPLSLDNPYLEVSLPESLTREIKKEIQSVADRFPHLSGGEIAGLLIGSRLGEMESVIERMDARVIGV